MSGAFWLGEIKYTRAGSYAVRHADLQKIEQEALDVGKIPWFGVEFRHASAVRGDLWIMVPAEAMAMLLRRR